MQRKALLLFLLLPLASLFSQDVTRYVCPFVGTTNYGTTNPGALCPNGLMSVCPFNVMGSDLNVRDKDKGWWSTPYEHHNRYFTGFSHVNLSGVGCPDMASLLLMPTTGEMDVDYHNYGSEYTREEASPGYYALHLQKYGILAEATATPRCAVERFTFPDGQGHLLLHLGEGLTNETGAWARRVSDTEIEGEKLLGTFCYQRQAVFPVYFVLRVSKRPRQCGFWKKQPLRQGVRGEWDPDNGRYKLYPSLPREMAGDDIGCYFTFDTRAGEDITVRMGVSFTSIAAARDNLEREATPLTFDQTRAAAHEAWQSHLSLFRVKGGTEEQRKVFYTALYHALIHPNIVSDCDGSHPLLEREGVGHSREVPRYTVFSLWDTYRTLHPLLTLFYPQKQLAMVRSLVDMADESGFLPRWELYGRETYTMEGDPALPVIADTWLKGLAGFDIAAAYKAMRRNATLPGKENPLRPDLDPYIQKGYIPLGFYAADLSGDNSVSHALEYAMADWALSRLAESLGEKDDASLFLRRARSYRRYYDSQSGALRPITDAGTFLTPFQPLQGRNFENVPGFHEGSAWNYTFAPSYDVEGLARLMGGEKKYVSALQRVFDEGWYDPTNEPDIVYPYLFSKIKGEEWRTQREVARLLAKHYSSAPDGLPGNDDAGALSAWAVWAMLGLYPDTPADPSYTLSTPAFSRIEVRMDTTFCPSSRLLITTEGQGPYIQSVSLGGKRLKNLRVSHSELLRKAHLHFVLGPEPKK